MQYCARVQFLGSEERIDTTIAAMRSCHTTHGFALPLGFTEDTKIKPTSEPTSNIQQ
jgi:hypothetical protein